jgi:hypothetical protein
MRVAALPLAALAAVAACSGPEVYEAATIRFEGQDYDPGDEAVQDVKVEVKSWLEGRVAVREVFGRVLDGRLAAQFVLLNESDDPVRVLLMVEWRDGDGLALRDAASELRTKYLVLHPDRPQTETFTAPTDLALQFYASIEPTHEED